MSNSPRSFRFWPLLAAAACLLSLATQAAPAADAPGQYPSKPLHLIVPFAPGGGNDTLARLVAQKLGERWSQQVIVENRAGAGGNIAAEYAAHAPADGYTLFLLNSANLIAPSLYSRLAYDPVRDFAPVTLMVTSPFLIVVPKESPLRTLTDLLAQARAHPGAITFASGGNGSATHLAAELFDEQAGVRLTHVPYKGAAPALVDVTGGRVNLYWCSVLPAMPHVTGGTLRALAITGTRRLGMLPDMPTVAELGLPNYEASVTYGIVAPAGTPEPIVRKLHDAIVGILASPEVHGWLESQGLDVIAGTPEDYQREIQDEVAKWARTVKVSGAKVD
jgi:tripartite-type tricarboxylate transporter receptor subunit TctC